jgi:GNAT superfamily N-acetyltransferase
MPVKNLIIRNAVASDIPDILTLVKGLAEYEHLTDMFVATEEQYRKALFGECPVAEALIAIYEDQPVGHAIFFHSFSTFLGKAGIYLEDLYVKPEHRGKGIGKALFIHVARLASERGCGRMEWSALNWNKPAINFYEAHGAEPLNEWTMFRLTGDMLECL